jgi:ABC-type nitrate/sulfonate/bicarbonate transport system substrate-binding protein
MAKQKIVTRAAIFGTVLCVLWSQNVAAADNVTFVTDFGFNGRHAYYYVALEKRYYKAANLDVKIVRGAGGRNLGPLNRRDDHRSHARAQSF